MHWEEILLIFLDITSDMIRKELFERLQDVFDVYRQTELYTELTAAINSLLEQAFDQMRESAGALYQAERFKPAILDDEALEAATTEALTKLQKARREQLVQLYLDKQEEKTGKPTKDQERTNKANRVTDEQIGPERFHKEVKVMAEVQAYYKLAKSRFTESIFVNMQAHTFVRIRDLVLPVLERQMDLIGPDGKFVHPPILDPPVPLTSSPHCSGRAVPAVDGRRSPARNSASAAKEGQRESKHGVGVSCSLTNAQVDFYHVLAPPSSLFSPRFACLGPSLSQTVIRWRFFRWGYGSQLSLLPACPFAPLRLGC